MIPQMCNISHHFVTNTIGTICIILYWNMCYNNQILFNILI